MRRMLACTGALALALVAAAGGAYADDSPWRVTGTSGLAGEDGVTDITVAPTGSTWAVGYQSVDHPLVRHLLSGVWTPVPLPSSWTGGLDVATASHSRNVWAFGKNGLFVRYDGTTWSTGRVAAGFDPTGAATASESDVWAVDGTARAYHWNGGTWSAKTLPAAASAVHVVSARDVWAAGSRDGAGVVLHYDGSAWSVATTFSLAVPPPADDETTTVNDITVANGEVWAVGAANWTCGVDGDDVCSRPFALHRIGSGWTSVIGEANTQAYGKVASDGSGGVWITQGAWDPSFVHLVGDQRTTVLAPRPDGHDVNLTALANVPGTATVWSAGASFPEGDPDDPTGDGVYLRTG